MVRGGLDLLPFAGVVPFIVPDLSLECPICFTSLSAASNAILPRMARCEHDR